MRWGALRNVVKSESGPQDGVSKSNAVIQIYWRRLAGTVGLSMTQNQRGDGAAKTPSTPPPRRKSLSSFSLNKGKYQEALARARKLAASITPVKNDGSLNEATDVHSNMPEDGDRKLS